MGDVAKKCGADCELCGGAAAVHCAADAAFLCFPCDAKVHGANFLASRHFRRRLAAPVDVDADSGCTASFASSSCVSTADSASSAAQAPPARGRRRRRRRARAEVVLEGWAKRMGLAAGAARRRAAASASALRALGRCVAAARVPLRVAMAAALWSVVGGAGEGDLLQQLEASAHVPARLVVTVASWMASAGRRAAVDAEEGWAECS